MRNKIILLFQLARFHSPTGYLLVFFPAYYGLILASNSLNDLKLLPILFIGSVLTRGAGCIINDLFDQKIDREVKRTKNRPLANKSLDQTTAILFLLALSIICLSILFTLSNTAIYLGYLAIVLIIFYPLMKRITNLPQIFLGITFNFGALIAYASVADTIELPALLMYIACCMWAIGYDIVYAFMDLPDDKRIGVKSMAILLEHKNYKLWLYCCYLTFIILFVMANTLAQKQINLLTIALALGLLMWQVYTLEINNYKNCLSRFKINNYVGLVLALSTIINI
uniref:4-hydroxybenzoate octaprenyltransferase n=1 Tax=Candidatus Trichorickettsia mobilis TaxID=1346319 RepID=UPI0029312CEA|nr:4-hydroxybenzoate octaprenyltransferase [Candidatus Trichorickettsia mobilis]